MCHRIVNTTKNTLLADKATIAETVRKRLVGLLGRKGLDDGEGLIIKPCSAIHTFFMRFPIDVIFLEELRVVKVIERIPPFRMSLPAFAAKCAIELPSGTIAKSRTEVGDLIEIKD